MCGLLGVAAAGAVAFPGAAGAQTGDSVVGSGILRGSLLGWGVDIDAHSGPSGENPTGRVTVTLPTSPGFDGSVGCLQVSDNVAIVGINFVNGIVPSAFVKFVDAGVGSTVPDALWITTGVAVPTIGPEDCPEDVTGNPHTLEPGDIVVTDVDPLPTSKDQCKNGGWRTFGVFKNQGDCVSFAATGGKKPPGKSRL
jgi:hypothetical protein